MGIKEPRVIMSDPLERLNASITALTEAVNTLAGRMDHMSNNIQQMSTKIDNIAGDLVGVKRTLGTVLSHLGPQADAPVNGTHTQEGSGSTTSSDIGRDLAICEFRGDSAPHPN
ncbi:hypothetical protein MKEN_01227400 [Mycena kentingensis (nom. inval.)]|nr:hypothetical protein MKEN_01227400 [Mycena kentingensis (nom. inval.)]